MQQAKQLRSLLVNPGILVAPGAYDAGTAMLVQGAGFPAVYMTGAGVSATYGLPDYGLIGMAEMVAHAREMAGAVKIPLIADADTGYGNELNVTRTVWEYEKAGVAAMHIEDQVSPKRCGHLAGKEVVPREDFLAKISAAVKARRDPDLFIIARTDARAVDGLEEAIARANAALDQGADAVFVEATQSVDEAASVPKRVNGPCLLNMVIGGLTPVMDVKQAEDMGYRIAILPGVVFATMVARTMEALNVLKATGKHPPLPNGMKPEDVFNQFGAKMWDEFRQGFRDRYKALTGRDES